ncbi:MAG: hypothetical protein EPN97_16495 [Alphaproteobacteria bacterium]|nr:MAG: hypothetical protein EPN97_16495 [Alphaproteobacteria bacterium]
MTATPNPPPTPASTVFMQQLALAMGENGLTPAALAEMVKSFSPRDRLEELLVTQIMVAHGEALRWLARAKEPDASFYMQGEGTAAALRFSKLMTDHMRTLEKYRARKAMAEDAGLPALAGDS